MRLVGMRDVAPGAVLGRDVLGGYNGVVPLLRRGVRLEQRYIQRLEQAGIRAVYVDDELGRGVEISPLFSDATRSFVADALATAFEQATAPRKSEPPSFDDETLRQITVLVRRIAAEVAEHREAAVALQSFATADAYTLQHSIDVTALGLLLGERCIRAHPWSDALRNHRLMSVEERLVQFGLGLMLHDVGKLLLPPAILNKPGPLDEREWALVRRHPLDGLGLLSATTTSAVARAVVRSHHERWDGSGYPDGTSGTATHQLARIAAVADVYAAVSSERLYCRARSPEQAWRLIIDGAGSAFDPGIVEVFRRTVAPYPPGSSIRLDDGRAGVVVSTPPGFPEQPRVRVGWDAHGDPVEPYELDLAQLPGRALVA